MPRFSDNAGARRTVSWVLYIVWESHMKVSVIFTAAALAFGGAAFAETPDASGQDMGKKEYSAAHDQQAGTAGQKIRHAAKRAGEKTRHAMHRMRDSMHRDHTAARDHDRHVSDTRAMGASRGHDHDHDHARGHDHMRGKDPMRGDRTRDDVDQSRRARMDEAYANWRSRQ
jgi:hypothetical protein